MAPTGDLSPKLWDYWMYWNTT